MSRPWSERSAAHWMKALTHGALHSSPPELDEQSMMGFHRFMRAEIYRFSSRYARKNVRIHADLDELRAVAKRGGFLVFLHYGSFFLSGMAVLNQLGIRYSAMVSGRNFVRGMMAPRDVVYWLWVHRHMNRHYSTPVLYSDAFPRTVLRWFEGQGGLMGMALDVREYRHIIREYPFETDYGRLHMQIGPARIAKMGKLPLIPMTITYNPQDRVHDLRIGRPINADDPLQATDNALNQLIAEGDKVRWQYYHDLGAFRKPWTGRLE